MGVVIDADEAITGQASNSSVLKNVQIEQKVSKKKIRAKSASWDGIEKVFKIPGDYLAVTPKGTGKGYGIKVNLDFVVTKISEN